MMVDDSSLAVSFTAALDIMKARAVSFYSAFSMLPADRFQAVAAVYAFCRFADDAADSLQPGEAERALDQLARLEGLVQRLYQAKEGQDEGLLEQAGDQLLWLPAFAANIRRFGLPPGPFLDQLAGQRWDIRFTSIQDTDQLIRYARLVAGSVGLMLLPMLARDREAAGHPGLRKACEELGIAMQITNILRDVGEDLRLRGRLYLPLDLLRAQGLEQEQLLALAHSTAAGSPAIPQAFIRLWETLAALADRFYQPIASWLCFLHPACRAPLLAAAHSYRAIADAVRAEGYNCFSRRCYTSQETRRAIFRQAALQVQGLNC